MTIPKPATLHAVLPAACVAVAAVVFFGVARVLCRPSVTPGPLLPAVSEPVALAVTNPVTIPGASGAGIVAIERAGVVNVNQGGAGLWTDAERKYNHALLKDFMEKNR